jgi:hypothetical protein
MIFETRIIISIANLYILAYVYMLEMNNCKCSKDWRRDFIFYYSLFYIFTIICFLILPEIFYHNIQIAILLKILLGVLLLVNIYCLYTYADKLEKTECECAQNFGREFMKIFSYFYVVVIVLVFIYLIHYYVSSEFKSLSKRRLGKGIKRKLTHNNFEKIMIVNKVN